MPISYEPKDAETAWPEGDYEGVLMAVKDKTSKVKPDGSGGKPMQVWTVQVYHQDGRSQDIDEYVVIPGATFKIRQLAAALGKTKEFEAGRFQADDYINANVTVTLSIEAQDGFDDKNRIKKFKPPLRQPAPTQTPVPRQQRPALAPAPYSEPQFRSDDIPFSDPAGAQRHSSAGAFRR